MMPVYYCICWLIIFLKFFSPQNSYLSPLHRLPYTLTFSSAVLTLLSSTFTFVLMVDLLQEKKKEW